MMFLALHGKVGPTHKTTNDKRVSEIEEYSALFCASLQCSGSANRSGVWFKTFINGALDAQGNSQDNLQLMVNPYHTLIHWYSN